MNGNNCGHILNSPRWFEAPENHTRPHIIKDLINSMQSYYQEPAALIPSLNQANGSDRQQRSERREACISVLGCLVHYLDLATMRVGIPQADQSFKGITMAFIAERCNLTLRRTERAVADLVKSGLLTVYPLCEKLEDATYKGYAAIRTISTKLFAIFGMRGKLQYERDKAAARARKKQRKSQDSAKAKIELIIDSSIINNNKGGTALEALSNIKAILNSS
ncbi:MAG: replication protein RepA [Methyloprofundus sp.]|nr:replication protein RepA [Methyloprofundus sp.]